MLGMCAKNWLTNGSALHEADLVSGHTRLPNRIVAIAIAVTFMVGGACGGNATSDKGSEATTSSNDKSVIHTLPWEVLRVIEPKTVVIVVGAGSCSGKPRIVRARPRYMRNSVYIQAEVAFPKIKWRKGVICGGTELFIRKSIKLKRDVNKVRLYDASANPPILRWPS
jgi:hypothetical protein